MGDKYIRLTSLQIEILQLTLGWDGIYGLEAMKAINAGHEEYGFKKVSYGKFYSSLRKLEEQKLLDAWWGEEDDSQGPRRRYYRINSAGRNTLKANLEYQDWVEKAALQPGLAGGGA